MIEIKRVKDSEFSSDLLFVDGQEVNATLSVLKDPNGNIIRYVRLNDRESAAGVMPHAIRDLPTSVVEFTLPSSLDSSSTLNLRKILLQPEYSSDYFLNKIPAPFPFQLKHIRFTYELEFVNWSKPWTIQEYFASVEQHIEIHHDQELVFTTPPHRLAKMNENNMILVFSCLLKNEKLALQDAVNYWTEQINVLIQSAHESLLSQTNPNALFSFFQFPKSIQTACEQYLLYFVQFLEDLGIEAEADIRHEAQQVLFSVTPKEGPEALDKIREALNIYLQLPGMPEFAQEAAAVTDIAVRQLEANVLHLTSQLRLAEATIEAKNEAIKALRISRQLLANSGDAKNIDITQITIEAEETDSEELMPGVEVIPLEGKGLKIDLPGILRKLKRRFGKE